MGIPQTIIRGSFVCVRMREKIIICVLKGDIRKPYRGSQLDNRSVVSCRSLWALLEFRVSRWILRSSAMRMLLTMEGVVETTSLMDSIKSVPLRGDPWGMPFSWERMDERLADSNFKWSVF